MTKLWRASTRREPAGSRRHTLILAFHVTNRYFYGMLFDMVRRICAALLTLALAFGPAVSSAHASSMGAKMTVAALSDMHSWGKCDDCGGSKGGMPVGACSMNCSGVTAVSSGSAVFQWLPVQPHGQVVTPRMTGL